MAEKNIWCFFQEIVSGMKIASLVTHFEVRSVEINNKSYGLKPFSFKPLFLARSKIMSLDQMRDPIFATFKRILWQLLHKYCNM